MYRTLSPMHIGHNVNLEVSAPLAEKYGFEGIFVNIQKETELLPERFRELIAKHQLKAAGFELPTAFWKDEAVFNQDLKQLEQYAAFAKACGLNACTTYVLPASDQMTYIENFKLHVDRGKKVAEILKAYDIRLGLEFIGPFSLRKNAKFIFLHTLEGMLELCDAIDSGNVGIVLDAFHWDMAGHTLADFKKITNVSSIVCVHINDAPLGIAPEEQQDLCRALPGSTGVIRIEDFFRGLQELNYAGPVLCEPFVKELGAMTFENVVSLVGESFERVWPENGREHIS